MYTPRHTQHMVRRILDTAHSAEPHEYTEGLLWYTRAHDEAQRLAYRHATNVATVVGVIAALSPQCGWSENLRRADALLLTGESVGLFSDKALRIYAGEDPLAVLGGPKTRAFYQCMLEPEGLHEAVVVDRHAFDVAVGRETDDKTRKVLERKGQYDLFADAYRKAAAGTNGLHPHELQAIAWVRWRNLKADGGPTFGA